ncbi:hypothetical protein [Glycocaulis sp.]|uniref:hypothetical protein n=1 Tax=Glycocaulis sp. TaxID=1969725 RepID=UPI003D233C36
MIDPRHAVPAVAILGFVLVACGGGEAPGDAPSSGSATASWAEGDLSFESTHCRAIPGGDEWTITASSDRNTVQVRYWSDDDGSYDTSSAGVTLELMDDNWRVLERYSAEQLTLDVSTENRASGEVRLTPHHSPGVGEIQHPSGAALRFDISC